MCVPLSSCHCTLQVVIFEIRKVSLQQFTAHLELVMSLRILPLYLNDSSVSSRHTVFSSSLQPCTIRA